MDLTTPTVLDHFILLKGWFFIPIYSPNHTVHVHRLHALPYLLNSHDDTIIHGDEKG